jgi:hypothetical protein
MENGQSRTVSAALRLPSGPAGRSLRRAVAIVDRVHMDGELPMVPVEFGHDADGEAYIEIDHDSRRQRRTVVHWNAWNVGWSLIHEVGHLLDYSAIGRSGAARSLAHPCLADCGRRSLRAVHFGGSGPASATRTTHTA